MQGFDSRSMPSFLCIDLGLNIHSTSLIPSPGMLPAHGESTDGDQGYVAIQTWIAKPQSPYR